MMAATTGTSMATPATGIVVGGFILPR